MLREGKRFEGLISGIKECERGVHGDRKGELLVGPRVKDGQSLTLLEARGLHIIRLVSR